MFINLSNHPLSNWSNEQLKAAEEYGQAVDLPFPDVSPAMTKDEIEQLGQEVIKKVQTLSDAPATVHIMGEMTLTYTLVNELKKLGYLCVASTTKRDLRVDDKGNVIKLFEFVQFREY